jgi:hypothetical protein
MTLPDPQTGEAVDFLVRYRGSNPIVLTAIIPDDRGVESATFRPAEEQEPLRQWIDARQGNANLYFSVNPTLHPLNGRGVKAKKSDVRGMIAIHADIDPKEGEDIKSERERIRSIIASYATPPTIMIDSGGGYQAFWILNKEHPANGSEDAAAKLEAYNKQMALDLGGDRGVSNLDRVMRLPGTINVPNETKRKRGRVPALSRLVEYNADRIYDLAEFKAAPTAQPPAVRSDVAGPASAADKADLKELLERVPTNVRTVIVHGHDPGEPERLPSRSEWLFYVCCELARAGLRDEAIIAIITNPDHGISASVVDKKRPDEYAARQAQRARDAVGDDAVAIINRKYFAVLEGRRVQYYREEPDGTLDVMQAEAFDFELAPMQVRTEDGKMVPASRIWKHSPQRRYYRRGFVLDPTESCDRDTYNLWKGFGVDPRPGKWPRLREHITDILADGNAAHADYNLNWTAWCLQNPATPPRVALVFKGGEGVGKGLFCNALVDAFGVHGLRVQNMLHVAGRFNAHLRHRCFLFADEAIVPNSDGEGTLKGLITEPTIPIEAKGVDTVAAPNHLHIVMASNNDWVVPASIGARRFAVFAVSDRRKGDAEYFSALVDEIENGGLAAMMHDLLHLPLGNWHPEQARPDTDELARQKVASLDAIQKTFHDCLVIGELPEGEDLGGGSMLLPTKALTEEVRRATRRTDVTHNAVADFLGERGFGFVKRRNQRPSGYVVPPLPIARAKWDELFFPVQWDATDAWETRPERDDDSIPY